MVIRLHLISILENETFSLSAFVCRFFVSGLQHLDFNISLYICLINNQFHCNCIRIFVISAIKFVFNNFLSEMVNIVLKVLIP